jgi:uncharacterized membrane protein
MNEFIGNLRMKLDTVGELTRVLLNAISLVFILGGIVNSAIKSFSVRQRLPGDHVLHTYFRRSFGGWLVVALEFQLAADIVGTMVSPSTQHLIELGAIALIRTFLNYFLSRELKEEKETAENSRRG